MCTVAKANLRNTQKTVHSPQSFIMDIMAKQKKISELHWNSKEELLILI